MTTVTAGGFSLDFDQLDLISLLTGRITLASALQFATTDSGVTDSFFGSFQYNGGGIFSGGTITRLQETYLGQSVYDISDTSIPVTTFLQWALSNDNAGAKTAILAGADSIFGSAFGDLLRGFAGADTMAGGAGNDTLDGGAGDDIINGNTGDDVITGGSGLNYLRGDEGNDQITGGSSFDDINGNSGNDTAYGGDGDDWVVGGKDNDCLMGDGGNDIVYGNLGNDTAFGGDGNDLVRGGQGDDSLSGGNGNDWLSGDLGNDTISGGAGADTFHTFATAGLDRVLDFSQAQGDRVQVDAGSTYSLSQVGSDTVIDMGGGNQMILVGVQLASLATGWIFTI